MLYTDSPEFVSPIVVFPGDEQITRETYGQCIGGRYGALAGAAVAGAEELGLVIDPETYERWKRVGVAAGLLDTLLDDSVDKATAQGVYRQSVARAWGRANTLVAPTWADDRLEPMTELLGNATAVLPEEQQTAFYNAILVIGEISVAKAETSDVVRYRQLLELEGRLCGILVAETASEAVKRQPVFEQFALWISNTMTTGTLIDSGIDLPADAKEDLTAVEPEASNQARILGAALRSTRFILHGPYRQASVAAARANRAFHRPSHR